MQNYIGTKQVKAEPCHSVSNDPALGEPGYRVIYPDGYASWSPKDVFERAYLAQGDDATRVTQEMVDDFIVGYEGVRMGNHTVLLVVLRNGFTLIEESACVDPANYDQEIGIRLALGKAKTRVWNHLGFLLATARNGVGGVSV